MTGQFPDLVDMARRLGYPKSSICILSGDETQLVSVFPDTYKNLLSCIHNRDKRTSMQYGQDLVASWLFEDMLMGELQESGISISKAGADRNREILSNARVSSSSDCLVSYNGRERLLELMSDYSGYWAKYHKLELRDSKFTKMQESKSLFLGISTEDKKFILLDMSERFDFTFIPSYFLYGGKPAYSIKLPKNLMEDLDFSKLAERIIEKL